MPSRHAHRAKNKQVNRLITSEDIKQRKLRYFDDRENVVSRMAIDARMEATSIIQERYETAREQTETIREKMHKWDLQYKSKFHDDKGEEEERIFLPKTREQINIVHAFIISMVSQLDPIVNIQPLVSDIYAAEEEYKRAKLAEAMLQFYFKDMWHLVDDIFPKWLKHFLKYSMGVYKISYYETDYSPDLNIEVVDRAFLYFDPLAHTVDEARWVIEEYYIPRSELKERVERGDWVIPDELESIFEVSHTNTPDINLERFFGSNYSKTTSIETDELIQCFDYWQFPRQGLSDVYATIIGGVEGSLVRYGRIPFPYKGNPFVASSFNPDDRPDGEGLAEQQEEFQKVTNTFLNLRLSDVRKNIQRTSIVPEQLITAQTLEDMENGNSIARGDSAFIEQIMSEGRRIQDYIGELPSGTSTQELLVGDLPFILKQGQEASNISDVFAGRGARPGATLGEVQEQLTRNSGAFRPVLRQVMRTFERIGVIALQYFKDKEAFPEERIIRVVGQNKYTDVIKDWQAIGGNTSIRSVSPDELDVDVTLNAISGSDALASRTVLMTSVERIFQSIGVVPELFPVLKENFDFSELFKQIIMTSGHDLDAIVLSPQEKEKRQQEQQQQQQMQMQQAQQQQQMQMQMQMQMHKMQADIDIYKKTKELEATAQKDIALQDHKFTAQSEVDDNRIASEHKAKISEIKVSTELDRIKAEILQELKAQLDIEKMKIEAKLEAQAPVNVGHDNGIQLIKGGDLGKPDTKA